MKVKIKDLVKLTEPKPFVLDTPYHEEGYKQAIEQIGNMEVELDEKQVAAYAAQGYCTKRNENKILDAWLLEDIGKAIAVNFKEIIK